MAETVTKLSAICTSCTHEAAFSLRRTADTAAIAIGGADMYVPACRACFLHHEALKASAGGMVTPLKAAPSSDNSNNDTASTGLPASDEDAVASPAGSVDEVPFTLTA